MMTNRVLARCTIALGAAAVVILGGCSGSEHGDSDRALGEEIRALQARFSDNVAELQHIADDVSAWRAEYQVEPSERDLLLSLLARPLAFHSSEPSDSTSFGRHFQQIEQRVARYRMAEYELALEFMDTRVRLQRIADANAGEVTDTTLRTPHAMAALPFLTCPNPDGCPDPGGPLKPCDPYFFDPGRVCWLIHEDCQATVPAGSGWMQQCRYDCAPIGILF